MSDSHNVIAQAQLEKTKKDTTLLGGIFFGSPCWARTMVCVKESAERLSAASQTLTDFVGVALRDYARNQKEKTTVGDLLFLAPPAGLEPATS